MRIISISNIDRVFAQAFFIILLVVSLPASRAHADDSDTSIFSFNGFGTVGAVHSSEKNADFTSSVFKPDGAGYSRTWSPSVDSLLAAQVTANFTPQLSAVLQVISEQNYDSSYRPHVEWANIKYQITPDFSVSIGRRVLPIFLYSDTRKVGYTYPWVRPPLEVYHLLPVTSNDGVDVSYRLHLGEWTNTLVANVGAKEVKLTHNGGSVKASDVWGVSNMIEFGSLTTRINYSKNYLTIAALDPVFDGFRQFGPQGVAIADKYDVHYKPNETLSVGVNYDPGNWLVLAEWARSKSRTFTGNQSGWYISSGYRFGNFMPYVVSAQSKASPLSDPGLTLSTLPPPLVGPATGLNTFLNSVLSGNPVTNTVSVGGRWDFSKNAALKLQFDHTKNGSGSSGQLINPQPGLQLGDKFNVFSATVDFVF